jgi:hypothetical protein
MGVKEASYRKRYLSNNGASTHHSNINKRTFDIYINNNVRGKQEINSRKVTNKELW